MSEKINEQAEKMREMSTAFPFRNYRPATCCARPSRKARLRGCVSSTSWTVANSCPIAVSVVASRIDHSDAANGFILDGFPPTVAQAEALDRELAARGIKLDAVLELEVDEDALLDRIRGRAEESRCAGTTTPRSSRPGCTSIPREPRRSPTTTGHGGCSTSSTVCSRSTPWPTNSLLRWQHCHCRPIRSGVRSNEAFYVPGAAEHPF